MGDAPIPRPDSQPKTVAIYSCGEVVGDGLYKIAFLQDLRRRFPDAKITWIAGLGPTTYAGSLAPLVAGLLDEVVENSGIGAFRQLASPFAPLGGRRFDVVVDTQRNVMRTLAAWRIRHGLFISGTAGFIFSERRPADPKAMPRSLIPRLGFLLDLVAKAPDGSPPPVEVGPEYHSRAAELLPDGPVYVGIVPGAGDRSKVWPLDNFMAVAKAQVAAGRVPVFILGPSEQDLQPVLAEAVPQALFPSTVAAGDGALGGPALVIALGGRMAAAVANDSGGGHMLALSQVPLVSLFSRADPKKYAPNIPHLAIVDSKDYGGPDPALTPLPPVLEALDGLLERAAVRRSA